DPDAAARAVHEGYSRFRGQAVTPWEQLPEEMRVSNRRVVSHIPAKLASVGFDLEPWLAVPDEERPWPPPLAPGALLFRDEAERGDRTGHQSRKPDGFAGLLAIAIVALIDSPQGRVDF